MGIGGGRRIRRERKKEKKKKKTERSREKETHGKTVTRRVMGVVEGGGER